jgi:hypothetical protein
MIPYILVLVSKHCGGTLIPAAMFTLRRDGGKQPAEALVVGYRTAERQQLG